ncbi:MAG: hypothetical protein ACRCTA_06460 [Bacilli bacterium]
MKKYLKITITIVIVILICTTLFNMYQQQSSQAIIVKIIKLQDKYEGFIEPDLVYTKEELEAISNKVVFKEAHLDKLYQQTKKVTYAKIEEQLNQYQSEFDLLKLENTTYFSDIHLKEFTDIVKINEDLFARIKKDKDATLFDKVVANNKLLQVIIKNEYVLKDETVLEFQKALQNNDTTTILNDNCFNNQSNLKWTLDLEASKKYCIALGLLDCNDLYNKKNSKFIGYSLNNPSILKPLQSLEYVSYFKDEFHLNELTNLLINQVGFKVIPEVYQVENNKNIIYKYNIILIPNDYELSCAYPNVIKE